MTYKDQRKDPQQFTEFAQQPVLPRITYYFVMSLPLLILYWAEEN